MRIIFPSYVHEQWRQPPNLVAGRRDGTGPTPLTHFSGAHAGVIGAVWAADGTHTARHKMGAGSRQRLPPNADGANERQLTHLGPRVNPACVDGEPANADASCSMCLSELWSQHGETPSNARHSKDRALARAALHRCRLR